MRKNEIPKIVFISSSTVYGEQETQPIPETAQLRPISNYGSSKTASEVYIHSYCKLYGLNGLVLRLANIMGPRSDHGVVPDFVKKLKENPKRLVILGNGKQKKSYLHVEDTISATILTTPKCSGFEVYNIGSDETIIVDEIAKIVCDEMKLKDVKLEHTSREKRGWKGDVSEFLLDTEKLRNLGWKPKCKTEDAIRSTVRWLVETRHRLAVF